MERRVHRTLFYTMKQIEHITSRSNPLVRLAHNVVHLPKRAKKEGLFAVEGLRLAEMAAQSRVRIRFAFVSERSAESARAAMLIKGLCARGVPVYLVTEELCASLSDTDTPQGVLLVAERMPIGTLAALPAAGGGDMPPFYVVLDRVQDPGNIGTILRTAAAAGVDGVILLRGCADVYGNKVVRATMGALCHMPLVQNVTQEELLQWTQTHTIDVYAAACDDMARAHVHTDFSKSCAVIFGNEANGVSRTLLARVPHVYVPMFGVAESLNVSAAAAVILYEAVRQRRFR